MNSNRLEKGILFILQDTLYIASAICTGQSDCGNCPCALDGCGCLKAELERQIKELEEGGEEE